MMIDIIIIQYYYLLRIRVRRLFYNINIRNYKILITKILAKNSAKIALKNSREKFGKKIEK